MSCNLSFAIAKVEGEVHMRHRQLKPVLYLIVIAVVIAAWFSQSQSTPGRSPAIERDEDSILRSAQKPRAPISDNTIRDKFTAAEINSSMRARRNQAWAIVQQVWQPVPVAGGKIPAWMTWYEQQDIAQLYRELLNKEGASSATPQNVEALLTEHRYKDLQTSLTSA